MEISLNLNLFLDYPLVLCHGVLFQSPMEISLNLNAPDNQNPWFSRTRFQSPMEISLNLNPVVFRDPGSLDGKVSISYGDKSKFERYCMDPGKTRTPLVSISYGDKSKFELLYTGSPSSEGTRFNLLWR